MTVTIISTHAEPWLPTFVKKEVASLTEFVYEVRKLMEDHTPNIEIRRNETTIGEWFWDTDFDFDEEGYPYEVTGGAYVLKRS